MLRVLIVGATGGLGKSLIREALARGHTVSIVARSRDKVNTELVAEVDRLAHIFVGDATDQSLVGTACAGQNVVFSGLGGDKDMAQTVATQCKAHDVGKFVFVAGATNVKGEDGVTPYYKEVVKYWEPAERVFFMHQACIDAIKATGINYVIFCPELMKERGAKSSPLPTIRIDRPSGRFVSYEDAAWVMMQAGEASDYDRNLISAATADA